MPLSWNEIKDRALAFSREWADESSERAEAKSFWDAFFNVFGVSRRKVATFEEPARRLDASRGYIDLFWRGMLVVEHKSRGKDLDKAFGQAIDYLEQVSERDLPRYVLVSDFARFRLYDLESGEHWEFPLKDLHRQVRRFGFVAGYSTQEIKEQDPVNIKAAERMGRFHDQIKASGYDGHPLEVYLVRLLFCLFADDTGIFQPRGRFRDWLETRTAEDGCDLGAHYTSEKNILKLIKPLFLDELWEEFRRVKGNVNRLFEFHKKLATLRFLDPACAGLYDPLTMPPALTKAHQALDRAVDTAYLAGARIKGFANDAERVAFLVRLYQQYTSLLPATSQKRRAAKRAS